MKYFFVLGTNAALSVAEITATTPLTGLRLLSADFLIADSQQELNCQALIRRLGGTIKIGQIVSEIDFGANNDLLSTVKRIAQLKQSRHAAGKFNFGFSDYGQHSFDKKDLGAKLKQYFNAEKISSRFVISREKSLSSVVVAQNKLLTRGIEIILARQDGAIAIGETLAVQPFKDLSLRDYGRPARDDLSGMLPPKLAQIMLNLAKVNEDAVIIDPFCGSGTVLSEALVAGYRHLFGSDSSSKAIDDTRKNISWLKDLYKIDSYSLKLFVKKVEGLSKFIKASSVDAVVTEPYLGPQRGRLDFNGVIRNLEELYSSALHEFYKVLKPGARVVMIWPLYYGERPMTPRYEGFRIVDVLPADLKNSKFLKKNSRPTIIYGRPGQKVYREIVVLEKK